MRNNLMFEANEARIDDMRRSAAAHRLARTAGARRPADHVSECIAIRRATEADQKTLRDLAMLDSAPAPRGEMLIAEVDGEARAALVIETGVAIADPFRPSAHLVELLELRAMRLTASPRSRSRFSLRRRTAYRAA